MSIPNGIVNKLTVKCIDTVMARKKWPSFYKTIGAFLLAFIFINILFWWIAIYLSRPLEGRNLPHSKEIITISDDSPVSEQWDSNCTFHNFSCADVHYCGYDDSNQLSVYIYPLQRFYDNDGVDITPPMSREFENILETIAASPYSTHNPETACLFVPSIDLLNQNLINADHVNRMLASLKWWNSGKNHLLFNMLPGQAPTYRAHLELNTSKAMIAGAGFSTIYYRRTFDVAIPVYNPLLEQARLIPKPHSENRKWFLISSQFGLNSLYKSTLRSIHMSHSDSILVLDKCAPQPNQALNYSIRCDASGNQYPYPEILQEGTFCFVFRGNRLGQPALLDVLMAGCIPVVVADGYLLPFHEVLDWSRASTQVYESQLPHTMRILGNYSMERIHNMRKQVAFYWQQYFRSLADITMTTLRIINERVFPFVASTLDEWNDLPNKRAIKNPLFLPIKAPKALGFTVVILTYNRIDSLFQVVRQVGKVPSLAKVIVVWNNQEIKPPQMSKWPNIGKPIKVIQTKYNRLSNRFFPYDEIETECILALDDDIVMLTPDEVEFGYEVWREHPDRLVGYPSRLHLWQNESQSYSYESEWMNAISMVLTGAAFHHKYFSYMYTYGMPGNLKQWVDEHINCEDIAMNFLVTNITGKAPIKVVPRKKFKCPACVKEMLSASSSHMVERSECINCFSRLYGAMPLKPVEFRADPVLYKDKLPGVLVKYSDLGTL